MVEQIRMMNVYLQAALEGREQVCQEIVYNYAHVYRKPVRDVLAMISVGLMDPTEYKMSKRKFGIEMGKKFDKRKSHGNYVYTGITIRTDPRLAWNK